jgi:hypothetical protein
MIGPEKQVVQSSPCMVASGSSAASSAARTTGMYSGLQPASTALIATFSTVIGARLGGANPITSSGLREVPLSMRMMRASVGGTTGRPSDQPRSKHASISSSHSPMTMRREARPLSPYRATSSSQTPGSRVLDPQPGRIAGNPEPRFFKPVTRSHSARFHPNVRATSLPFSRRITVGTASTSKRNDCSSAVSSRPLTSRGKLGSSWVNTAVCSLECASSPNTGSTMAQVSHSRFAKMMRPSDGMLAAITGSLHRCAD